MKIFLAWFFLSACVCTAQNILLIIADDYGADSSSLYNTNSAASLPPTPNINNLAASGVLFRNGYANPVCSPTRACLITGRHGFRTGIGDVITGPTSTTLSAAEFTIAEAFAANASKGYQVAQFGKWHLATGPNSPSTIGGWPHFAGSLQGAIANYTNWTKTVNGTSTASVTNYATSDIVNDAVAWIAARGAQPWFAWVAFNAPHTPLHKPPANLCPTYASLPGTQIHLNNNPRLYYEAMVEALDTEIGRLLSAVDRSKTHIIFLGDNGSSPNVIQPPYSSTKSKDTLYEGGIKVPFVVAGPGVVSAGRTNYTPVHAVDIYSTILEMAGINWTSTIPAGVTIDSQSLMPMLTNDVTLPRYSFSEHFSNSASTRDGRALRNSQFKLIRFDDGREEFYDLLNDPYESTNLLSGALNAAQQANYYGLVLKLGNYQTKLPAPVITSFGRGNNQFSISIQSTNTLRYSLWRGTDTDNPLTWAPVQARAITNGNTLLLTDTNVSPSISRSFYRVQAGEP